MPQRCATGLPALSDDSGPRASMRSDGQPGVYTANWAETPDGRRDFMMAMQKTEDLLRAEGARRRRRSARAASWPSSAWRWPDGDAEYFRGEAEGTLVWPPRGDKRLRLRPGVPAGRP